MNKHKILIVDDDKNFADSLAMYLQDNWQVGTSYSGIEALNNLMAEKFHAIILDYKMHMLDGFEVLREIQERKIDVYVIILTGVAKQNLDILKAGRLGANDYFIKPIRDFTELEKALERGVENISLREKYQILQKENIGTIHDIIGTSKGIVNLKKEIKKVAVSNLNVVIRGETGVGKELVAAAIHSYSLRANESYITVNCAAITESLIEDELFGHEEGAFTNANRLRRGKVEIADKGTLFLDEIGDMSLATQARVLRILEHKGFARVGGEQKILPDVRFITATHKNLEEEIIKGNFRQDLYYRLNKYTITVPPLRARKGDIPLLIDFFIKKYSRENKLDVHSITDEAVQLLTNKDWPGNVRELENVIERAIFNCEGETITSKSLQFNILKPAESPKVKDYLKLKYKLARSNWERDYIIQHLKTTGGNITQAAKNMGMFRNNLKEKMNRLNIKRDSFLERGDDEIN